MAPADFPLGSFSVHVNDAQINSQVLAFNLTDESRRLAYFLQYATDLENDLVAYFHVPFNWSRVIDDSLFNWLEEGYPCTNQITQPLLLKLIATAALIDILGDDPMHNNTAYFGQLLAHGDQLLLDAQRIAQIGTSDQKQQALRLINHSTEWRETASPQYLSGDEIYVDLIINLRKRTRGADADPLGPRP